MKKVPGWLIIVLLIGALIASKYIFFSKNEQASPTGGGGKAKAPVIASYFVAQNFEFNQNVYSTGKIGALNEVELKPEVAGKVMEIYFKEGETIHKGAPILKINDAELQAQVQKVKIQIKLAEEKVIRLKKLLVISGVSQEEFDIQENELASLKADLQVLNTKIAETLISAPFTGVIGLKNISEGAYITPAQVVASLVQVKPVYVEFTVPEKYSSLIQKNMNITFTADNEATKTFSANVYAIEPKIDENTKTLRIRAMYNGNQDFFPGSYVRVNMDLKKSGTSLMIPTQAVVPILKGQKVFISRNGIADEVKVITGVRTEDKIQILEGLNVGDTVLTTGLMSVKKDSKLKLIKASN